jgi:hypothetical protein
MVSPVLPLVRAAGIGARPDNKLVALAAATLLRARWLFPRFLRAWKA